MTGKIPEELYYKFRTLWTERTYSEDKESRKMRSLRYGEAFVNFCYERGVTINNVNLFNETDGSKAHGMIYDYVDWEKDSESLHPGEGFRA